MEFGYDSRGRRIKDTLDNPREISSEAGSCDLIIEEVAALFAGGGVVVGFPVDVVEEVVGSWGR